MKTRAKFVVKSISENVSGFVIEMLPVTNTSEENAKFFKWTPYGELKMGVVNKEIAVNFRPGKEFYLDFIEV